MLQDTVLPCRTVELGFQVSLISVLLDSVHVFVGPTKISVRKLLHFPDAFVFSTQFLVWVCKCNINFPVAVMVSTLNRKPGLKMLQQFSILIVQHVCYLFCCSVASGLCQQSEAACHISVPSLYIDKLLLMHIIYAVSTCLLSNCNTFAYESTVFCFVITFILND